MTAASVPMRRAPARALVTPTLTMAVMLAILLALGFWQLHRRVWKLAILADIDRTESSPPIALPAHPLPFAKVTVTGRFADATARYGVQVHELPTGGSLMGAQLVQPLLRPGQPPVLVDRGWVAAGQGGGPAGDATVIGYIRMPDAPGLFSPADDLTARQFYTLDPAAIGAALGLPNVAPFTLVAMGSGGMPEPATALPRPPNDHLNYALTWFGLAGSLLVVYGAFVRKALRA